MPGALHIVTKGRLINKIDKLLEKPTEEQRMLLLDGTKLSTIGVKWDIIEQDETDHADKEWFGGPDTPRAWFPSQDVDKELIIRTGYLQAYEIALFDPANPKPIVTYWINGFQSFEVVVADSLSEVQVFWLTPFHTNENPPPPPADIDEELWVVAHEKRINQIKAHFPEEYGMDDRVSDSPVSPDIKILQLKGY